MKQIEFLLKNLKGCCPQILAKKWIPNLSNTSKNSWKDTRSMVGKGGRLRRRVLLLEERVGATKGLAKTTR
jgi:hypothetical protein